MTTHPAALKGVSWKNNLCSLKNALNDTPQPIVEIGAWGGRYIKVNSKKVSLNTIYKLMKKLSKKSFQSDEEKYYEFEAGKAVLKQLKKLDKIGKKRLACRGTSGIQRFLTTLKRIGNCFFNRVKTREALKTKFNSATAPTFNVDSNRQPQDPLKPIQLPVEQAHDHSHESLQNPSLPIDSLKPVLADTETSLPQTLLANSLETPIQLTHHDTAAPQAVPQTVDQQPVQPLQNQLKIEKPTKSLDTTIKIYKGCSNSSATISQKTDSIHHNLTVESVRKSIMDLMGAIDHLNLAIKDFSDDSKSIYNDKPPFKIGLYTQFQIDFDKWNGFLNELNQENCSLDLNKTLQECELDFVEALSEFNIDDALIASAKHQPSNDSMEPSKKPKRFIDRLKLASTSHTTPVFVKERQLLKMAKNTLKGMFYLKNNSYIKPDEGDVMFLWNASIWLEQQNPEHHVIANEVYLFNSECRNWIDLNYPRHYLANGKRKVRFIDARLLMGLSDGARLVIEPKDGEERVILRVDQLKNYDERMFYNSKRKSYSVDSFPKMLVKSLLTAKKYSSEADIITSIDTATNEMKTLYGDAYIKQIINEMS